MLFERFLSFVIFVVDPWGQRSSLVYNEMIHQSMISQVMLSREDHVILFFI